jgi:WhiB family redox-sensing transcriptional regulator
MSAVPLVPDADGPPGWHAYANCLNVDPDTFFPERGASLAEAKEVCRNCVVSDACLDFAITNHERFGVWGGASPRERRRIAQQRARRGRL